MAAEQVAQDSPGLTIVVPAYNEEHRLVPTLEAMERWLADHGESFEVVVVDDGSRDATLALAREFADRHAGFRAVGLPENRGKGAAVRQGFVESRGDHVLFSDADLSTPLDELLSLRAALGNGAGLAIASRALPESNLEVRQAWYREAMGKTFNAFVRLATGLPVHDTQCGFKLLRGDDARAIAGEMREDGFSFDVELLLLAGRRGLKVAEVPVTWRNDEGSRVSPVGDAIAMLLSLPRIVGRTGRYRG